LGGHKFVWHFHFWHRLKKFKNNVKNLSQVSLDRQPKIRKKTNKTNHMSKKLKIKSGILKILMGSFVKMFGLAHVRNFEGKKSVMARLPAVQHYAPLSLTENENQTHPRTKCPQTRMVT
jgi:hypothetical protein